MASTRSARATPSLIEPLELRSARIATVALLRPIDKPYSYLVPEILTEQLTPGMRVTVPFGRNDRPTPAFCLAISDEPWRSTLKSIIGLVDRTPILRAPLLELGHWISTYYASHLGRTLDLMVPSAAKRRSGMRRVRYVHLQGYSESASESKSQSIPDPTGRAPETRKPSRKQADVLCILEQNAGLVALDDLIRQAGCTSAVVQSLARRGRVRIETRLEYDSPPPSPPSQADPPYELNDDQRAAVSQINAAIEARAFSVQVLFGVTGSGKTEVYISAIRRALALGRQAIMLVPEIALTTQTVRRLALRFDRVATIHSAMSEAERARTWDAVARGEVQVVIGTRSAVFAPCPALGLLIVDEEAEPSFKSQASPRYHTRDVAVKRGQIESVPIILGSATPSLETWLNVQRRKHYHLLRMPRRVRGLAMPAMHLVDMNEEHRARPGVHMLSRAMEDQLRETLGRGEQAVVLLNRRGYASYLHCAKCRTVLSCPHCSVRLVFHQSSRRAHCHYCAKTLQVPDRCANLGCGGTMVKFGLGTERVEEQIARTFPSARVRRIDSDVMQIATDYADLLGAFERREFDVLVGTQMVAKGLDFPFVSFVGVISADTALAIDDFRSEERTFQLVLQVAGRSGRADTGGVVVVQTFAADTVPIQHAVRGDYEGFAKLELQRRQDMRLPPFTRMMRIILSDGRLTTVKSASEELAEKMRSLPARYRIPVDVMDPHPAAIARLRDQYRYDVLTIFPTAKALTAAVAILKDEGVFRTRAKGVTIDVDPVSLQ